jgi:cystathionine gamma-synthase
MKPTSTRTKTVRAALAQDVAHKAVVPPLYLSTNYAFDGFGHKGRYDYSRSGNPTRDQLADALAALEGGAGAVVTGSGMGAVGLVAHQQCAHGDLLIAPHDCYGGTVRLILALERKGVLRVRFIDFSNAEDYAAALALQPRLVWIETPSNPLLRITDLEATIRAAKAVGATVCVDNTFLTPVWQQPLSFGADLVVHSTTKYLNGHSDVVGGVVISATAELHQDVAWWGNCLGLTGGAFDSYLTLRGLRTLHARLQMHEQNAHAVVSVLAGHPAVCAVHYPGLADHPQHALAATQQSGFGAMVSFELRGGLPAVEAFLSDLHCFTLAESLGGVESLVAHPASMTHASMSAEAKARAGLVDGLLRLSVGIEEAGDLAADLAAALERAARAVAAPT